jgi:tripartite-type tricarboxylate transporter receptor subunit TctC
MRETIHRPWQIPARPAGRSQVIQIAFPPIIAAIVAPYKLGEVVMKIKTKAAFAAIAALAIVATTSSSIAQSNYPDRAVKVIVGYAPAGPVDIIARVMSDKLAGLWGKPVVVENIPGAGGNISGDRVAKAAPDGYTLLMGSNALLAINPSLYSKMSFDPNKDLIPISEAVYSPNILVVPNNVPAKNVKELVDYARAHPGKLTFGSAGVGTTQHLAGELFKAMAHLDIQHVPYRGASPVITDLLAGRLTMFFGAIAPLLPLVHQGKVRALAVTSPTRFAAVPDLPTMIEAGYPGFVSILSIGLMAPAGTPPAIIEKIHQGSAKVLAMPDVRAKLNKIGMEVVGNSPAEFKAAIAAERPQWAKIMKDAGIAPSH